MSTRVLILGAGNIGVAICHLLAGTEDYQVVIGDQDGSRLENLEQENVEKRVIDVDDPRALRTALEGTDVVVSACPYYLTVRIAAELNAFDVAVRQKMLVTPQAMKALMHPEARE